MTAIMESRVAPVTQKWRPGEWWARVTARRGNASLSDLPEHLRKDVGVDGGLPLSAFQNGGRVFISYGRPNSTLSGWHW